MFVFKHKFKQENTNKIILLYYIIIILLHVHITLLASFLFLTTHENVLLQILKYCEDEVITMYNVL